MLLGIYKYGIKSRVTVGFNKKTVVSLKKGLLMSNKASTLQIRDVYCHGQWPEGFKLFLNIYEKVRTTLIFQANFYSFNSSPCYRNHFITMA